MLNSFFQSLSSYGKWDPTTSEKLSENDKKTIDRVEVMEGQYGPTACFFLKGTHRVKMVQMDDGCEDFPIGTTLDVNSVVFQHYTDGKNVATRCIANAVS